MKRLIETEPIDVLMLQETLCSAEQITRSMQAMTHGWSYVALDSSSQSGGLAIGVNTRTIKVEASWGGGRLSGAGYIHC